MVAVPAAALSGGVFWLDADAEPEALEIQRRSVLRTFDPTMPELPRLRELGRDVAEELDTAL